VRVNCEFTADCVRGLDKGWEGKELGQLCVDSRLCEWDWLKVVKGREWVNLC